MLLQWPPSPDTLSPYPGSQVSYVMAVNGTLPSWGSLPDNDTSGFQALKAWHVRDPEEVATRKLTAHFSKQRSTSFNLCNTRRLILGTHQRDPQCLETPIFMFLPKGRFPLVLAQRAFHLGTAKVRHMHAEPCFPKQLSSVRWW